MNVESAAELPRFFVPPSFLPLDLYFGSQVVGNSWSLELGSAEFLSTKLIVPVLLPPHSFEQLQKWEMGSEERFCKCDLNYYASELNWANQVQVEHQSELTTTEAWFSPSNIRRNLKPAKSRVHEDSHQDENLYILKGYKYDISYIPSKGPRRRKRIIHCGFAGWTKQFIKAWNFLDHARMHTGEKPFEWKVCSTKFTQKGNLKKHMKKHEQISTVM